MSADRLVALLDVEGRLLAASSRRELAFILVNDSHALVPYRQAVLWSPAGGVEAVSGLAVHEPDAPFVLWLKQVLTMRQAEGLLAAADLPPYLAEQWADWLPPFALCLPVGGSTLLFARDEPWNDGDRMVLNRLALVGKAMLHGFERRTPFRVPEWVKTRKTRLAVALLVVAAAFPVTGSVLAPAEMVPAGVVMVRSPLEGAVDRFHVKPNDAVVEGQPLFDLDPTTLQGRLDIARQQAATAEAELRQAAQAQVFDPKAKAQVAILASRFEEKTAEVKWLEGQLERIHVRAPRSGITVFDEPSEWVGRPVTVGEKVVQIADETDTEVEAWLAVADAGEARPEARLTLFLNVAPLSPVRATVRTVAYDAINRPDGTLAHRVRATLATGETHPRLGLKGTARIDGDTVPLVWWLFRRPLATARQRLGL